MSTTDVRGATRSPVLLIFLGVALFTTGWTAINFRGGVANVDDLDSRSSAVGTVVECAEEGPVSLSGVGYWWSCRVDVEADDGETYEQTFGGSEFTPADIGNQFPLASAGMTSNNWSRADVDRNTWAVILTAAGLISGLIMFGAGVRNLFSRY